MMGMTRAQTWLAGGAATLASAIGGWWYVIGTSDRVAPEISIVSPVENAALYGPITIQVAASDDTGVHVVRFAVDDEAACVISQPPYICVWDATAAGMGEHYLGAIAYDAQGNRRGASVRVVSVAMLEITTVELPGGMVGEAYSAEILSRGGAAPYTWEIFSGSLPPGLSLVGVGDKGLLSGTPTSDGTWNFVVAIKDSPIVGTQQVAFLAIGPHEISNAKGVVVIVPKGA